MKRSSVTIATLAGLLLLVPAADAQNSSNPSVTTTTSYTNTANGSQGSHRWWTSFTYSTRDPNPLQLHIERTWTPASGHTLTQLKAGSWVYEDHEVRYEQNDQLACLQQTSATDPTVRVQHRFTQCRGTLSYFAWIIQTEVLPAGSVWNLAAGRHYTMLPGGQVTRWISSDRRTMTVSHVNTRNPEPDQLPHRGVLWNEDLAGGQSGGVVEDGGFATFSNGGLCSWRTDSSTPDQPIGFYVNEVKTTCVDQGVAVIDARCVARIVLPEEVRDRPRDRDEDNDHQKCSAHAELTSTCKIYGPPESPCANFAMYRHWWWTLINPRKRWTSGCSRNEGVPRPLHSEIYRNRAGRSVLHCWTNRFGSRWLGPL